jgi:hypothetical protein
VNFKLFFKKLLIKQNTTKNVFFSQICLIKQVDKLSGRSDLLQFKTKGLRKSHRRDD